MIEQRTLLRPGQGIISPENPMGQHQEYPKHMAHPGFQPGQVGEEIKSKHGFSYHAPGTAIRLPPVLVMDEKQEEFHAAQGYVTVGKSDAAAFERLVRAAQPVAASYEPVQYPKWVNGMLFNTAEDEAEYNRVQSGGFPAEVMVALTDEERAAAEPALNTEINAPEGVTLEHIARVAARNEDDEIAMLEARLADIKAKKADKARRAEELKAAIAAELAEGDEEPIVTLNEPVEPLVMKKPVSEVYAAELPDDLTADPHGVKEFATEPRPMTHGEKIAAGKARKARKAAERTGE